MRNPMLYLSLAAMSVSFATASEWNNVEADGMCVRWRYVQTLLQIELAAPTEGWVAVGFHDRNVIVGAELFMAAVQNGSGVAEHHHVLAAGAHPRVESAGRRSALVEYQVRQDRRGHIIAGFMIDHTTIPRLNLSQNSEVWLILAYSVAPEFDHHSRVRRHVRVRL